MGLAAYEKAGGTITGDLFGEVQFLDDPALLQHLANEKLGARAEKLHAEGWGWIEVAVNSDYGFTSRCDALEAKPTGAPKKLLDKHAKLQAEYDRLDAQLDTAGDEDDEALYLKLAAKLRKLQEQIQTCEQELDGYSAFDPEEMKAAGCYVTIGNDGKISINKGLVKPEDKKAAAKGETQTAADTLKPQAPLS